MPLSSGLHWLRSTARKNSAIVFVHGFTGLADETWGQFPSLLLGQELLVGWDVALFGYDSHKWIDLPRLWAADPPIGRIADMLVTETTRGGLQKYRAIAFVAHSMGGLVCQRAILDSPDLALRTSNLILFGTPSRGLNKARLFFWAKRQLAGLSAGGHFIKDLRRRWAEEPGDRRVGRLVSVSGGRDEFVNEGSAQNPFHEAAKATIVGNHLSLVKPDSTTHPAVTLVLWELTNGALVGQRGGAAIAAVERTTMREHVGTWLGHAAELDDHALVTLTMSLEALGEKDKALSLLLERWEQDRQLHTDVLGVLAGRIKRRWLLGRKKRDGEVALAVYQEALRRAERDGNRQQAFYQAINVAFLHLVFARNEVEAAAAAQVALNHCNATQDDYWKHATVAEAYLIRGDVMAAMEWYWRAVEFQAHSPASDSQRQLASTLSQARVIAEARGFQHVLPRLQELFGAEVS